jgi:hypothetical protein
MPSSLTTPEMNRDCASGGVAKEYEFGVASGSEADAGVAVGVGVGVGVRVGVGVGVGVGAAAMLCLRYSESDNGKSRRLVSYLVFAQNQGVSIRLAYGRQN